jgi:hypothetical protein
MLKSKDFASGLMFIGFGAIIMVLSHTLPMGNAMRMGPGYFPNILGGILVVLGLMIAIGGLVKKVEAVESMALRPILTVLGGVLAFAFLIEPLGLVVALFCMVFISSWGERTPRLLEIFILFLVLVGLAVGVFIYGLKLPMKVWPL